MFCATSRQAAYKYRVYIHHIKKDPVTTKKKIMGNIMHTPNVTWINPSEKKNLSPNFCIFIPLCSHAKTRLKGDALSHNVRSYLLKNALKAVLRSGSECCLISTNIFCRCRRFFRPSFLSILAVCWLTVLILIESFVEISLGLIPLANILSNRHSQAVIFFGWVIETGISLTSYIKAWDMCFPFESAQDVSSKMLRFLKIISFTPVTEVNNLRASWLVTCV